MDRSPCHTSLNGVFAPATRCEDDNPALNRRSTMLVFKPFSPMRDPVADALVRMPFPCGRCASRQELCSMSVS